MERLYVETFHVKSHGHLGFLWCRFSIQESLRSPYIVPMVQSALPFFQRHTMLHFVLSTLCCPLYDVARQDVTFLRGVKGHT